MAKDKQDETIIDVENVLSSTEQYIEDNKQNLTTIIIVLVAIVGGYFGYKYLYLEGEEEMASNEIFMAEKYYLNDSIQKAINGDGIHMGLEEIVEDYGITKSGNLAHYYLGMCYLKSGRYEEAIDELNAFDGTDQIVAAQAIAAIGDAYMEQGAYDEAITHYLKAAKYSTNSLTTPIFLRKAAIGNEDKRAYLVAIQLYERIKAEFPNSSEAQNAHSNS